MNNDDCIVEVLDEAVNERGGTFEDDAGKERSYNIRTQDAKIEKGGFIEPYSVRLQDGQKPWAKGRYRFNLAKMINLNKGNANFSKYAYLVPLVPAKAGS